MKGEETVKPKENKKTIKPRVEKKEHDVSPGKDEDIIVKISRFRLYFQNKYTIISLTNDLFTGGLYFFGTLIQVFTDYARVGMYFYIFGSFFLLMRPILKIAHNVFFYNEKEYEEEVLNKEEEESDDAEKTDKPAKEVEVKTDSDENKEAKEDDEENREESEENRDDDKKEAGQDHNEDGYGNSKSEIERGYNEDYYGENKVRLEKENDGNDEEHKKNE